MLPPDDLYVAELVCKPVSLYVRATRGPGPVGVTAPCHEGTGRGHRGRAAGGRTVVRTHEAVAAVRPHARALRPSRCGMHHADSARGHCLARGQGR